MKQWMREIAARRGSQPGPVRRPPQPRKCELPRGGYDGGLLNLAVHPLRRVGGEHNGNCPAKERLVRVDFGIRVKGRSRWRTWPQCIDVVPMHAVRRHRMTVRSYRDMLRAQSGVCALCPAPFSRLCCEPVALSIDHDHACCDQGYSCGLCVRGLLCNDCNFMVAQYERRAAFMTESRNARMRARGKRIAAYLAAHQALRAARD
ncbi:endonuclease domain-containing protein [Krasilnikovia sp. MM14-A1259]|uniref:endonuclease domain-containing protein n=1 Tax=Krasilnikovia sp. MM14-A1259 TaxID=3373539 RepID=UPI003804A119